MLQVRANFRLHAVSRHAVTGFLLVGMTGSAWAQKAPAPAPAPTSGAASAGNTGRPNNNTNSNTNNFPNSNNQGNTLGQGAIYLAGRVMFDDGTQPDRDIRIERVCNGNAHVETHADSKGRFSFQVGQNTSLEMDASESGFGGVPGRPNSNSTGGFGNQNGFGSNRGTSLIGCELRASYPGYRSDVVELGSRRTLDAPDIGTIVLHHLGNVQGTTISLTTALAPKDARKEYEKALQLAERGKFEEAQRRLANATELYPKYAVAWYALGQVQQKQGHTAEARQAYEHAVTADSRYVSPYDKLALLAAQEGKWDDAAKYSKQAIGLNPVEFPSLFWYNALANYNLQRPSEAEKSTKDLLKLDTRHNYPEAENLMAQLLLNQGNYEQAATHLRSYLVLVPNAKNADTLKQLLLKMDAAKATPPAGVAATTKQ